MPIQSFLAWTLAQTMTPERAQSYPHPRCPRRQIRVCINVWSGVGGPREIGGCGNQDDLSTLPFTNILESFWRFRSWLREKKSLLGELSLEKTLWYVRRHRHFHPEVFKSIDVHNWVFSFSRVSHVIKKHHACTAHHLSRIFGPSSSSLAVVFYA
ncbi:hypothetical protein BYT27DRAFT_6871248 [Phlegmacium glaucopus]|nr:hypothetical protein BYT27DRAFT_6871248 [Phlegmacium glaucopus]